MGEIMKVDFSKEKIPKVEYIGGSKAKNEFEEKEEGVYFRIIEILRAKLKFDSGTERREKEIEIIVKRDRKKIEKEWRDLCMFWDKNNYFLDPERREEKLADVLALKIVEELKRNKI
jgi:hypothetical protein